MTLTADCPSCGCPGQHIGMACGYCARIVPEPADAIRTDGTVNTEQVIGWRAWECGGDPIRLHSQLFPRVWEPEGDDGEGWQTAECFARHVLYGWPKDPDAGHTSTADDPALWPPVKGCCHPGHGCGFYAARTRAHLVDSQPSLLAYSPEYHDSGAVMGQVEMAGKIIPAQNGWRAQFVRPVKLYVPYELWQLAADLKSEYGPFGVAVDVSTTTILPKEGDGCAEWCIKCKAKLQRSATCPLCGHVNR